MRFHRTAIWLIWIPVVVLSSKSPAVAQEQKDASIDLARAQQYFDDAQRLFSADNGQLWGTSLAGPMMFVDPRTRKVVTNSADAQGRLDRIDEVFTGQLPPDVMIANTAIEWSGVKWTMLLWPLPENEADRNVLLAHEAWHRIQDELGFPGSGAANKHLNTLNGRYLLQLEWRALKRALESTGEAQLKAITDALAFRRHRHALFAGAAKQESAMELHEGLAEYTGVRLALNEEARKMRMIEQLQQRPGNLKSFVRSFAYLSGPAYGVLLATHQKGWLATINTDSDLAQVLKQAANITLPTDLKTYVEAHGSSYGAESLWVAEKKLDDDRQAILENYTRQFTKGPRLIVPLKKMNMSFNPNKLIPVEGLGTVYLGITVSDEWGVLKATGDVLMSTGFDQMTVAVPENFNRETKTADWQIELENGWTIEKMSDGVFTVRCGGENDLDDD